MKRPLDRASSQFIKAFRLFCLAISLSIGFSSDGIAEDTKDNAELRERRTFIEKANDESWEHVGQVLQEMYKRGHYPKLRVTTLKPFADWDFWYVDGGDIEWRPNPGQKFEEVTVPAGFVTDLASIPRLFWQALRPEGRYSFAAVVHDYLYWEQNRPREEADKILKFAMEDSKVNPKLVETIYLAVRTFGQTAWDNNAKLKKAGERRFLKRFPEDFWVTWSEWKKKPDVFTEKVRMPTQCALF